MITVDLAMNYADYAEGNAISVILPAMPKNGDTILLGEESFRQLKNVFPRLNSFTVEAIYLIEDFTNPLIILKQNKTKQKK